MNNLESKALIKTIAPILKDLGGRLKAIEERPLQEITPVHFVKAPDVAVTNAVNPTPVQTDVHVDMTPVAKALESMAEAMADQTRAMFELIKAIQRPVTVNVSAPIINVPKQSPVINMEPVVHVPAPQIDVHIPERQASQFVVRHQDGSETVIERR